MSDSNIDSIPSVWDNRISIEAKWKEVPEFILHNQVLISRKFQISAEDTQLDSFEFPVFPNEEIRAENLDANKTLYYAIPRTFLSQDQSGNAQVSHVVRRILSSLQPDICLSRSCCLIYFYSNFITVMMKRLGDVMFMNTYKYGSPEEVLYILNYTFRQLRVSQEQDVLFLGGQITMDSQIAKLLSIYFRNVQMSSIDIIA